MRDFKIGYQASLEQYQPDVAFEHAIRAEKVGFDSIWASDHFLPWYHTNASAVFAWTWLASVAQASRNLLLGTGATCPTLRYHPGVVAEAFASLDYMYPGRFFVSFATGEALNEVPLGYRWPSYTERAERLEEAVAVIRKLWSGDWVTMKGKYYNLKNARLYTPPKTHIPVYIAASGPTAAEIAGRIGDGFLTVPTSDERYKEVLFPALEKGIRAVERNLDGIDMAIEIGMSYDEDVEKALKAVRPWAGTLLPVGHESDPREIELMGAGVSDQQLSQAWTIATSSDRFIEAIERFVKMGFRNVHVTSSSPDENKFIEMFGHEVIPYLKDEFRT
ncbi:MAG: TIGR03557 family F420-dependent LLM class oxidoreductase [Candidatus Bathyarchaeia archaeon]